MFQEFPKMLYQGDQHVIATDADHEAQLREEGWASYGEDAAPAQGEGKGEAPSRPTGRARKTAAPAQGEG